MTQTVKDPQTITMGVALGIQELCGLSKAQPQKAVFPNPAKGERRWIKYKKIRRMA